MTDFLIPVRQNVGQSEGLIQPLSMTEVILVSFTLKQKVIILLARLFPLKSVCMESASSTSLENMFHSSWYSRWRESNRVTRTRASSSWKQKQTYHY